MRFLLIDRVTEMKKGRFIEGVKAFSLSEDFLNGHFPEKPVVPAVMFVESMAQLLGWLVAFTQDFKAMPLMAQIRDVAAPSDMRPGFAARIRADLLSTTDTDSAGSAEMFVDEKPVASIGRILYTHMPISNPESLRKRFEYAGGWKQ